MIFSAISFPRTCCFKSSENFDVQTHLLDGNSQYSAVESHLFSSCLHMGLFLNISGEHPFSLSLKFNQLEIMYASNSQRLNVDYKIRFIDAGLKLNTRHYIFWPQY